MPESLFHTCLLLVALLAAPAVSAQAAPGTLEDRLARCAAQRDDSARLACFDRIVTDRAHDATGSAAARPAGASRPEAMSGAPRVFTQAPAAARSAASSSGAAAPDQTTPDQTAPDQTASSQARSSRPSSGQADSTATRAGEAAEARSQAARSASAEESFGLAGSELARRLERQNSRENPPTAETERLDATVTEISKRPRGELVVTLDNGQVWAQKTARYFPLKTGDQVTILKGALRSYRLVAGGRSMQVTRVE